MGSSNEGYSFGKSPLDLFLNKQLAETERLNHMQQNNSVDIAHLANEISCKAQTFDDELELTDEQSVDIDEAIAQNPFAFDSRTPGTSVDEDLDIEEPDAQAGEALECDHQTCEKAGDNGIVTPESSYEKSVYQSENISPCSQFYNIPMDKIVLWENRLRIATSKESIQELANSIIQCGLKHPVVVKKLDDGKYELVVGFRRYLAYKVLKRKEIPATISRGNQLLESLIENIQREDLSALQRAEGVLRLKTEYRFKRIKDIAQVIGKAENTTSEILSLNKFPDTIKDIIRGDRRYTLRRLKELVKEPKDRIWEEFLKYQDELGITRSDQKMLDSPPKTKRNLGDICIDDKERGKRMNSTLKLLAIYKDAPSLVQKDRLNLYDISFAVLRLLGYKKMATKLHSDVVSESWPNDDDGEFSLP